MSEKNGVEERVAIRFMVPLEFHAAFKTRCAEKHLLMSEVLVALTEAWVAEGRGVERVVFEWMQRNKR